MKLIQSTPRLFKAMHRMSIPAASVASILSDYRQERHWWAREIIRAAFQNRHLTQNWKPYPQR